MPRDERIERRRAPTRACGWCTSLGLVVGIGVACGGEGDVGEQAQAVGPQRAWVELRWSTVTDLDAPGTHGGDPGATELAAPGRISGGDGDDLATRINFELALPNGTLGLVEIETGNYDTSVAYHELDADGESFSARSITGSVERSEAWCACRDLRFALLVDGEEVPRDGAQAAHGARRVLSHGIVVRGAAACIAPAALPLPGALAGLVRDCPDEPLPVPRQDDPRPDGGVAPDATASVPGPTSSSSGGWPSRPPSGGCEGTSSGGCEGDSSGGGCEGDSGGGGCEGDSGGGCADSGGCAGDTGGGGCAGDVGGGGCAGGGGGGGCGGGGGGTCRLARNRRGRTPRTLPLVLLVLLALHCAARRRR